MEIRNRESEAVRRSAVQRGQARVTSRTSVAAATVRLGLGGLVALAAAGGGCLGDPSIAESTVQGALVNGAVTANLVITNDWGSGYTAELRMSNTGAPTTAWTTVVRLGGSSLGNAWNASVTPSGDDLTAKNLAFNAAIPATTTTVWGFQGAGSGRPTLTSLTFTGSATPPPPDNPPPGNPPPSNPLPSPPSANVNGSTCVNFGTIFSTDRLYYVMNNVFNDAQGSQCMTASGTGFTVTSANHNIATNGAPASYTAFVRGCHFGTCTTSSNMPKVVSTIANIPSNFSVQPAGTAWDAAYDIWFDRSANTTTRNNALEMMIWLGSANVQPIGSQVDTATIAGATWQVWYTAGASPPVISYRRTPVTTSMPTFDIMDFVRDAMGRNAGSGTRPANGSPALNSAWFLTSVQAGFELWQGGAGAQVRSFAAAVN
jgi:hypothetical protein